MIGKSSKKDLQDAGRRKLDAWKAKQKSKGASHPALEPTLAFQPEFPSSVTESGIVKQNEISLAEPPSADASPPGGMHTTFLASRPVQGASEAFSDRARIPPNAQDSTSQNGNRIPGQVPVSSSGYTSKPPPPKPIFQRPPLRPRSTSTSAEDASSKIGSQGATVSLDSSKGVHSPSHRSDDIAQDAKDTTREERDTALPGQGQTNASAKPDDTTPVSGLSAYAALSDSYLLPGTNSEQKDQGLDLADELPLDPTMSSSQREIGETPQAAQQTDLKASTAQSRNDRGPQLHDVRRDSGFGFGSSYAEHESSSLLVPNETGMADVSSAVQASSPEPRDSRGISSFSEEHREAGSRSQMDPPQRKSWFPWSRGASASPKETATQDFKTSSADTSEGQNKQTTSLVDSFESFLVEEPSKSEQTSRSPAPGLLDDKEKAAAGDFTAMGDSLETASMKPKRNGLPPTKHPFPSSFSQAQESALTPHSKPIKHTRVASLNTWGDMTMSTAAERSPFDQIDNARLDKISERAQSNNFNFESLPESTADLRAWPSIGSDSSPKRESKKGDSGRLQSSEEIRLPRPPSFSNFMQDEEAVQSDTFSALQDHIDELTQEKFELKRGLEQQQEMASSLARENQRLLDDYNQQGARLQALEKEMEKRHSQISAQQIALDGVGVERDAGRSVLQEALERAENLAAEVVSLEEKAYKSKVAEVRATKRADKREKEAQEASRSQKKTAAECIELKTFIANLQEQMRHLQEELQQNSSKSTELLDEGAELSAIGSSPLVSEQAAAKEQAVSKMISRALEKGASRNIESDSLAPLPEHLNRLLPTRTYKGNMSGEAAEKAAEQKQLAADIHDLLRKVREEKVALLMFLRSEQERCQALKIESTKLKQQINSKR